MEKSVKKIREKLKRTGRVHLDKIVLAENYRTPHNKRAVLKLATSIKKEGLINPVLLEEKINDSGNIYYEHIAGERRILAHLLLNEKTIKSKVYFNLTPVERLKLQLAENIKKPIPREELAESNFFDYKVMLAVHNPNSENKIMNFSDFGSIHPQLRKKYSVSKYAKDKDTSFSTMKRDLLFSNLHATLQELVRKGKLPFSLGAELGRIKSKKRQMEIFQKYHYVDAESKVKRSVKDFSRIITKELNPIDETFEMTSQSNNYNAREVSIKKVIKIINSKIIKGIYQVLTVEPISLPDFENIAPKTNKLISELENKIHSKTSFLADIEERFGKEKTIREKIVDGDFSLPIEGNYKKHFGLNGPTVKIKVNDRVDDPNQPRKTYDKEYIKEIGESLLETGQISPVVVRTKSGYKKKLTVVGHNRFKGAELKGIKYLDGYLIENMSDFDARLLQIIEDYYEQPSKRELAEGLGKLYILKKAESDELGVRFTKKKFLEEVKWVTQSFLDSAITYQDLDEKTKSLHEKGVISYGTAIALAKLLEEKRYIAAIGIIAYGMNATSSTNYINELIEDEKNRDFYDDSVSSFFEEVDSFSLSRTKQKIATDFVNTIVGINDNLKRFNHYKDERFIKTFYDFKTNWQDISDLM